jgi:hypothetical protein
MQRARLRHEMVAILGDTRQLHMALSAMSMDAAASGEPALPADGGPRSVRAIFNQVVDGYLSRPDAERLFQGVKIANVSKNDPRDTVFFAWGDYDAMKRGDRSGKRFIAVTLGGEINMYYRPSDAQSPDTLKLPPREPAFLPEE